MRKQLATLLALWALPVLVWCQNISGTVSAELNQQESTDSVEMALPPLIGAKILLQPGNLVQFTDENGQYKFGPLPAGNYTLYYAKAQGNLVQMAQLELQDSSMTADFTVPIPSTNLKDVEIYDQSAGPQWLRGVDRFNIFAAKKTEHIILAQLSANLPANNARQIFSRVAGLNIWENDGGGLQLGIGGRGLSPNRNSNFNTRQNGYDIAADALGYPESYYSPPMEAIESIQIVRGAASLQYGTQFGGMVNFGFKKGPQDKKIEVTSRQTLGSFKFFSSFNSIGGQVGKLNYYAFYQGKRGDGWRENSGFKQHTAFGSLHWQATKSLHISSEYTFMHYLAQQAGGLTDAMFARDPRQSIRDRNWFRVSWNLASVTAEYKFSARTKLNCMSFGLLARRDALGYLAAINRIDLGGNRDLISGSFQNFGNETRLVHRFNLRQLPATLLIGARYYRGYTTAVQGTANNGSGPEFQLLNPSQPEGSDYAFPSQNVAVFAEQVMHLNAKWSLVPGLRYEFIQTEAQGSYELRNRDLAGNVIFQATIQDQQRRSRNILLGGIGVGFKPNDRLEVYGNVSRNYRAITFTDMRVINPNFQIDPNLQDERGFNADLGFRGKVDTWLGFDMSLFYLRYQDRIGQILMTDSSTFRYYRLRTNVADSRNIGLECFAEADLLKLFGSYQTKKRLTTFVNIATIDARYVNSKQTAFNNKFVELVPRFNFKTGLSFGYKSFKSSLQWSYLSKQYSDATNAEITPNAVEGLIPAYQVLDLSANYTWRKLSLEASCNNLLNAMYFTRRAAAYPGPGIIPADGRSFFLTLQVKI